MMRVEPINSHRGKFFWERLERFGLERESLYFNFQIAAFYAKREPKFFE